jgi:hypothetical protein
MLVDPNNFSCGPGGGPGYKKFDKLTLFVGR